jgi:hypothetical protein
MLYTGMSEQLTDICNYLDKICGNKNGLIKQEFLGTLDYNQIQIMLLCINV